MFRAIFTTSTKARRLVLWWEEDVEEAFLEDYAIGK